jgi:hypothetical protein
MPTFEVEVDDVDVQRYESMFPSLPDEKETQMADQVVAPIAPTPTFDVDADTVISMLMLVMAVAVALSVVLATRDAAEVDDDDVFMIGVAVNDEFSIYLRSLGVHPDAAGAEDHDMLGPIETYWGSWYANVTAVLLWLTMTKCL